jgi:DNA-directed DNA polymerase III PolC
MYVHLRTRSTFSFLESLASPTELAQAAARLQMPALGLVEHRTLSGAIEFYDACRLAGVKPLMGLHLEVSLPLAGLERRAQTGSLALLAMDLQGWGSLCRLSSALLGDPAGAKPALAFEELAQDSDRLICLSGGRTGLAARLLAEVGPEAARPCLELLGASFPGRFYVELQRHSPADQRATLLLASLAQRLHLPTVATHDIHYLFPEQAALQRVVSAIRTNTPVERLPSEAGAPPEAAFLTQEEMARRFADLPAALETPLEIAGRCNLELPLGTPLFPEMDLPAGRSTIEVLRQKAEAGALRLYADNEQPQVLPPEIHVRLEHELAVIEQCGYAALFLIVEEILDYAHRRGVPVSSRGSAASSLVAHCLGITSPDPVRLNLYFERFLNPARHSPPDIDTDLCSRRRDDVIDFVYRRFGRQRVATVCTISRFRRRSALRETAKAYGLPAREVSALAEGLPHRWYGPAERSSPDESPFGELKERFSSPLHQAIFRDAEALIGIPDHLSVHPGGVVIAPAALTDLAPLQMASKGMIITQFDLEAIERLGLVKIDLLGIRGLSVLGDVAEVVCRASPAFCATPLEALESIPEDDPQVAELVRSGRTIGCFQIESPGMRATLKEIQAQRVDDLMVALALYRPGPLTGGLKDAFVRRYRGQEKVSQLHPALAPLLEDTYGVILYQEQVLRIAHELAGLSLADADLLRRAMSHFDPGKQMQTLKEKFIAGAFLHSGVPEGVSERIWELMAAFAGYGFPKAHAASYAQVAWRSAWCKVHQPAVFMAAILANWGGYYSQRIYLSEARRMGLSVRPPHVNYAQAEFSVSFLDGQAVLFMGLDQVRELTRRTQQRIQRERPFRSFEDFLARVDPRRVEAENLVRAGAFEGMGRLPALLGRLAQGGWQGGQLPLFSLVEDQAQGQELSLAEKVAYEEAALGVSLSVHPLELYAAQIAASGALTIVEAAGRPGQRLRVAGMRQFWRRSGAAGGEHIYFLSLEDLEGMLEVVISADVYRRSRPELSGSGPYVIEGLLELERNRGEPFLRAERIWAIRQG